MNYNDVLSFWFSEIEPPKWWTKNIEFDRLIEDRFLDVHKQANKCELYQWRDSAKGRLAEIIVLDQFSRNIYRDKPEAFLSDQLALVLAQEAISLNKQDELNEIEKTFLYMPYMHSESLKIHDLAVELYKNNGVQSNLDFEIQHRNIIERFGRYPHRNVILNRISTSEELAFLQQPGSAF